jgi:hypothetical protein
MDEPETQVRLEVVAATMSSPIFHDNGVDPAMVADTVPERTDVPESAESPELPRIATDGANSRSPSSPLLLSPPHSSGDAWAAIIVGHWDSLLGTRLIDRNIRFSFGEGFVGYADAGRAASRRQPRSLELETACTQHSRLGRVTRHTR